MTESLKEHKGRHRLLVVFAWNDARLDEQRKLLEGSESASTERDLVTIFSPDESVRREFGVAVGTFTAILVGKDGTEKARFERPVSPEELFRRIDEMPMRKRETRKRETRKREMERGE